MATARTIVKLTPKPKLPYPLDQELGAAVLDKCRDVVQEYADLARRAPDAFPFSERDLLTWYAEMRYKVLGAGSCSLCGSRVRHALPVMAELEESIVIMHACLCDECIVVQQSVARRVTLCMHRTEVDMSTARAEPACAAVA